MFDISERPRNSV